MNVKIFVHTEPDRLEADVNSWLKERKPNIVNLQVTMGAGAAEDESFIVIVIQYEGRK